MRKTTRGPPAAPPARRSSPSGPSGTRSTRRTPRCRRAAGRSRRPRTSAATPRRASLRSRRRRTAPAGPGARARARRGGFRSSRGRSSGARAPASCAARSPRQAGERNDGRAGARGESARMTTSGRFSAAEHDRFADDVRRESFCVLRGQLDRDVLRAWGEAFRPLLEANVKSAADDPNRGPQRFYVTLPFSGVFADPRIVFDPDVLAICARLVGDDMVMCQLATDTPLRGSDTQPVHRDSPGLFPEWDRATPPYQLAVNFSLVDVVAANGPTEIACGTHMLTKEDG